MSQPNAHPSVHFEDSAEVRSAETLPESLSVIDFHSFMREFPDKLFPLIFRLRAEFQELFLEYHLLEKSQSFVAKIHGQGQDHIWESLKVIERALGALLILGSQPSAATLEKILGAAGVNKTVYGKLSDMIAMYAETQSYAAVAEKFNAPLPAVRKIFHPAVAYLSDSKDIRCVAVASYLQSLMHRASLRSTGLSKKYAKRMRRIWHQQFTAPPLDDAAVLSFGNIASLKDTPWIMLEVSSEQHFQKLRPALRQQGKTIFGKAAGQIFAPIDDQGQLKFGYVFARGAKAASLLRIRGIFEMTSTYYGDGNVKAAVSVPDRDIQDMIGNHREPLVLPQRGDFVEILTGFVARYCGTVSLINAKRVKIQVDFPTGRTFTVDADPSAVRVLPNVPPERRGFWGVAPLIGKTKTHFGGKPFRKKC